MKWIKSLGPFIIITIIGLCIFIFSIYDIIFDKDWIVRTFASYALLLIITIIVIFLRGKKQEEYIGTLEEFEKTLKGGLYHFKCQTCSGIFAIKKSKSNNKKYVKMTCPDCGVIGFIPPSPMQVEEEIPEKKSAKAKFKCNICGEGITVWAEGADLYKDISVYSCPFCGEDQTMKRI
jgi:predicted RNA-binding Zn-ribbon protein involved in translation (DUF1610 family)